MSFLGGGGGGDGGGGLGAQLGGIIGGYVGRDAASGDKAKAQGYVENAYNELLAIGYPPDLSKEIIYEKFKEAGILTPVMEEAINQGYSKVAQLQEAPETRDAQMQALQQLRQLSRGGLGAQDRAALNQVRDQTQRDLEAKRQQILQNAQARGMGGSGAELISQLQASQAGANSASAEGDRLAAMAQERALQALGKSADLAGGIRGQDYEAAMNRARAEDELNRFNVQNQMARQQRNVGAQNIAQEQNLTLKQRAQDANVRQSNEELLRQQNAKRDYWNDLIQRAKLRQGAQLGLAGEYGGRARNIAQSKQDEYTAIGGFAEDAAKAVATMGGSELMKMPSSGGSQQASSKPTLDYSPYDSYMERKYRKIYGMED